MSRRRIALHAAFWLAFWFIYVYAYSRYDGNWAKYMSTEALQLPARMLATYLSIWCFERFSGDGGGGHKTWLAFSGAAASNLLGGLLNRVLKMTYLVETYFPDASFDFWSYRVLYDVFDCVIASSTALSARMYFRQQTLLRNEARLRAEKSEAQLQALKAQLQPHFLFNTINNLYALARVKSDRTAPVALRLAQLLRYVLYESQKPGVSLQKEVQLLRDYVELEKIRFDDDRLTLHWQAELDDPAQDIAPLLLLPLVENAFKHGVSEQRDAGRVAIAIVLKNKVLSVKIENSKSPEASGHAPPGIGLQNLRQRLALLYPERHSLEIEDGAGEFVARLRVELGQIVQH
jgi:two-component system, LytTR family, sensor kinase